jgi:hypothetical protein
MIEARGRTGRKPTSAEKRPATGSAAGRQRDRRTQRANRLDQPPSWRGSFTRASVAALLVLVFSTLLLKLKLGSALVLFPIVLLIYVPLGYYTDLFLYRRRQRQKAAKR